MNTDATIEVFTSSGVRVGTVQNCISVNFIRSLYGVGNFTFQINYNTREASLFSRGYYIRVGYDDYKCGVITEIKKTVDQDGKGGQIVTISGTELKGVFSRRVVVPSTGSDQYSENGVYETVIKNLIKSQAGSTATASRQISGLTIATDQTRGGTILLSGRYSNVMDEVSKSSTEAGCGLYAYLSATNTITVETIHGVDRRSSQSTNNQAIFSTSLGTVKSAEISDSESEYKNLAIVGGQGEGSARTIRVVYDTSEPTGIDRREYFIDARNLSATADLDQKGAESLESNSVSVFMDAQSLAFTRLAYKTDFNLGDLVTIKEFGLTQDARVTKVLESWENGRYEIDLTFDREKPRLDQQIQRQFTAVKAALASSLVPQTYGTNLLLSLLKNTATFQNNATDASNDIDFLTILAIDTTGAFLFNSSSTITKRLDASWTAGTNQGGLDTGSEATSTWYACWAIAKADGTIDYLFSLSATAPTMPTGYVYKAFVRWIYNQSSGAIAPFAQFGDYIEFKVTLPIRAYAASSSSSRQEQSGMPSNCTNFMDVRYTSGSANSTSWFRSTSFTDVASSSSGISDIIVKIASEGYIEQVKVQSDSAGKFAWRQAHADWSIGFNLVGINVSI